jgi:hypothetical protein
MTNQETARQQFEALDSRLLAARFEGCEAIEAEFGYRHGWLSVNGEGFNRDKAFPERFYPRFPADQGCSD